MLRRFFQAIIRQLVLMLRLLLGRAFIKMNFQLLSQLISAGEILRILGAEVGEKTHIPSDLCLYNLHEWSCRNLRIGSNVYVGPRCVFDLTEQIVIENDVAISANVSLITHMDVGNQPLKQVFPRREGAIRLRRGAWIGVGCTVLHGVTIGEHSMIGAMSLVNRSLPDLHLAFGIPCKVVRPLSPLHVAAESGEPMPFSSLG